MHLVFAPGGVENWASKAQRFGCILSTFPFLLSVAQSSFTSSWPLFLNTSSILNCFREENVPLCGT